MLSAASKPFASAAGKPFASAASKPMGSLLEGVISFYVNRKLKELLADFSSSNLDVQLRGGRFERLVLGDSGSPPCDQHLRESRVPVLSENLLICAMYQAGVNQTTYADRDVSRAVSKAADSACRPPGSRARCMARVIASESARSRGLASPSHLG